MIFDESRRALELRSLDFRRVVGHFCAVDGVPVDSFEELMILDFFYG